MSTLLTPVSASLIQGSLKGWLDLQEGELDLQSPSQHGKNKPLPQGNEH